MKFSEISFVIVFLSNTSLNYQNFPTLKVALENKDFQENFSKFSWLTVELTNLFPSLDVITLFLHQETLLKNLEKKYLDTNLYGKFKIIKSKITCFSQLYITDTLKLEIKNFFGSKILTLTSLTNISIINMGPIIPPDPRVNFPPAQTAINLPRVPSGSSSRLKYQRKQIEDSKKSPSILHSARRSQIDLAEKRDFIMQADKNPVFELLYTDKNTGNTLSTKAGEFNEYEILKKDKSTSGLVNAHVTNREIAERFGVSKATAVAVRWFPELNKEEEMIALQNTGGIRDYRSSDKRIDQPIQEIHQEKFHQKHSSLETHFDTTYKGKDKDLVMHQIDSSRLAVPMSLYQFNEINKRYEIKPDQTFRFHNLAMEPTLIISKDTEALNKWLSTKIAKTTVVSKDELFRRAFQRAAFCNSVHNCTMRNLKLNKLNDAAANYASTKRDVVMSNFKGALCDALHHNRRLVKTGAISSKQGEIQSSTVYITSQQGVVIPITFPSAKDMKHEDVFPYVETVVNIIKQETDIYSGADIHAISNASALQGIGDFSRAPKSPLLTLGSKGAKSSTSITIQETSGEENFYL